VFPKLCGPNHLPCRKAARRAFAGAFAALWLALPSAAVGTDYEAGRAGFRLRVGSEVCPYRVFAFFVLPDAKLDIRDALEAPARAASSHDPPQPSADAAGLERVAPGHWRWRAPGVPGLYPLVFRNARGDSMRLNLFVLVPASKQQGDALNGYRIGQYPASPLKGQAIYKPPRGFVEVTASNQATWVSPHFQLRQFLCKQAGGFPKYLVLRERLLLKLEALLERVNEAGFRCDTFHVMSGYRTPWYNRTIGNVKYSRHVWGGAADVFIDVDPVDGMMDDLNGDGALNWRDGKVLYDLVDEFYGKAWYRGFEGGLGRYKKTASHGPFVHVDVRGYRARWGD